MVARPYRNMRVDELERLFSQSSQDDISLGTILGNLGIAQPLEHLI
jgi:hypothetical protein